jgi:hypothetical protein
MNETINQLKEIFYPLAEKIGEGAEFGWHVIIRQQYVKSVGWLLASFVAYLAVITGLYICRLFKKWHVGIEHSDDYSLYALPILLIGIGLILGTLFLYEGVARLINPEYYAIEFLINLIK